MAFHDQLLFPKPRSKPARRLVELRARRAELNALRREAHAAGEAAQVQLSGLRVDLARVEAREFALNIEEGAKALRGRVAKTEKAASEGAEQQQRLTAAVEAVDGEMMVVAGENLDELLSEIGEDYEAARGQAAVAAASLGAAHGSLRASYAAAAALCTAVDPTRGRALNAPPVDVAQLVADGGAQRLRGRAPTAPTIAAVDDPDEDVREAARLKVIEAA